MPAPNDNAARSRLRKWWTSPERSGMRLVIAPWEYRHLRTWARVRIGASLLLTVLGLITLSAGGTDGKTYAFALVFLAAAAAHGAVACWLLKIDHSVAAGTRA